jgi:hypothetical protein
MQKIALSPVWCDVHLAQCWHSYDDQTGRMKHLGNLENIEPAGTLALADEMHRLKELGYTEKHTYPGYIMTRYKSQPLALPLAGKWQSKNALNM